VAPRTHGADSRKRPSRRRVVAAGAALAGASLAGCSFVPGTRKGATEVVLHNERTEPISVSLAVTGEGDGGEPRVSETIDLDSLERARPNEDDQLPVGTDYAVEVDVEDGPTETFEWRDVRVELAPLHVIVDGSDNVLFALEAG